MMNKFVLYKSLTKHLLDTTTENSKVVQSAYENAMRVEAISKTMEIVDLPTMRDIIVKFKARETIFEIVVLFLFHVSSYKDALHEKV